MSDKKSILLFTDWYEPGFKAGGPIRSCKNLVDAFSEDYKFFIVTSDRDLGDTQPYQGVELNTWTRANSDSTVFYASPGSLTDKQIRHFIREIAPDIVYLNSMFSAGFTLKPLWTLSRMNYAGRIILAPRGMLKSSALSQKPLKKKIFLQLAKISGWGAKVVFHATDAQEEKEIRKQFGEGSKVVVAPNVPAVPKPPQKRDKKAGELKIVFLSRIHPIKNLRFAFDVLEKVSAGQKKISFDIYGSVSDDEYYTACFEAARKLENKIDIQFLGQVEHEEVSGILCQYHLFFLPTLGENFGHAVFEALSAGCPVLISDQTPWSDVEQKQAGWALPLNQPHIFIQVIERLYNMQQPEFDKWSAGANQYAAQYALQSTLRNSYHQLFAGINNPD